MRVRLVFAGFAICVFALIPGSASAVLGGQPDTSHPYVVMLADGVLDLLGHAAVATVVLTAAHCFAGDGEGAPVRVYFGQAPSPGNAHTGSYYFDPQFGGLGNGIPHADSHDVAIVIFSTPFLVVTGGQYGALPAPGLVDTLKNNTPVDLVGYGIQGFRAVADSRSVGGFTRFITQTTAFKSNGAIGDEFMKLHNGSCFGDSGGPDLLGGTNIVLAENSFVNNKVCAGNTYSYRVDTPQALNWITSTAAAFGGSF